MHPIPIETRVADTNEGFVSSLASGILVTDSRVLTAINRLAMSSISVETFPARAFVSARVRTRTASGVGMTQVGVARAVVVVHVSVVHANVAVALESSPADANVSHLVGVEDAVGILVAVSQFLAGVEIPWFFLALSSISKVTLPALAAVRSQRVDASRIRVTFVRQLPALVHVITFVSVSIESTPAGALEGVVRGLAHGIGVAVRIVARIFRDLLNSYACGLHVSNVVSLVIGEAFRESQLKIFEVVERISMTLVEVDGVVHGGRMNLTALNQLVLEATLYLTWSNSLELVVGYVNFYFVRSVERRNVSFDERLDVEVTVRRSEVLRNGQNVSRAREKNFRGPVKRATHQRKSVLGVRTRGVSENESENGGDDRKLQQDFGRLTRHAVDQGRAPPLEKHENRMKLHRQVLTVHNSFQCSFDSQCLCVRDAVHSVSDEGRFASATETGSVVLARGRLVARAATRFCTETMLRRSLCCC